MIGISSKGKENIGGIVDSLFDKMAFKLLGSIPALKDKKALIFTTKNQFSLANLFVAAMNNQPLNEVESDVLKGMLDTAHGYVESLKNKTKSNVTDQLDAMIKEAKAKGVGVSMVDVQRVIGKEMEKAKSHVGAITMSEATKARNLGVAMDISRVAASVNDKDPIVFFVIVRDGKTCNDCMRLHMMPDGTIPRLWYLSELKAGYGKRGDDAPSMVNRHPHCRCQLTYLGRGYGFNGKGFVSYVEKGYDALKAQRGES
jgi:hypothetical protein